MLATFYRLAASSFWRDWLMRITLVKSDSLRYVSTRMRSSSSRTFPCSDLLSVSSESRYCRRECRSCSRDSRMSCR